MLQQLDEMRERARARRERLVLLGYHHASGIGSALAGSSDVVQMLMSPAARDNADRTTHVWRLDQPADTARIFRTVAEVDEYLATVETYPRYSLTLDGNPRLVIETERGRVRITDKLSGEHFTIERSDLESFAIRSSDATQLTVHADTTPTIGDWTQD
jgi:hypothetical protein